MSIKKLLVIVFCLIGITPMVIMAGYSFFTMKSSLVDGIGSSSSSAAEFKIKVIQDQMEVNTVNMQTWSNFASVITAAELAEDDSERSVHYMLKALKKNYHATYDLHAYSYSVDEPVDKQVIRIATSDDKLLNSPIPPSAREAIKKFEADNKLKTIVTHAQSDYSVLGEGEVALFADIYAPIYSDEDLMGVMSWRAVNKIGTEQNDNKFILLFDEQGNVIAQPSFLEGDDLSYIKNSVSQFSQEQPGGYFMFNKKALPYLVSYSTGDGVGFGRVNAAIWQNSKVALKAVDDMTTAFIIIFIVVNAIVLVVAFFISNFISKPLVSMGAAMKELAEGHNEIEIPVAEDRKDEIGEMGRSLIVFKETAIRSEQMAKEQAELERKMEEEKVETMNNLANDFESKIGGLISSLAAASTELEASAQSMKAISEQTTMSTDQMASSTEQTISNVGTVSSAMVEMTTSSDEISQQVTAANTTSNDTSLNVQKASEEINNLNILVQDIGEVAVAIGDIAEQTNLLALNATIEAARAGDAGKGFAVVADEVKSLATETANKTDEINNRIAQVQAATRGSVDAMSVVIDNVSDITEAVMSISAAIEEQNATTSEVSRSVSEVSSEAQQMHSVVSGVKNDAEESMSSSEAVLVAAKDVAELSENINKFVGEFIQQISSK